jgi:hypothetical protein
VEPGLNRTCLHLRRNIPLTYAKDLTANKICAEYLIDYWKKGREKTENMYCSVTG